MTVQNTLVAAGPYYPNGSTTVFPFGFKALSASEVSVVTADALGNETTLASSLYSVTLNADMGGSVTFTAAPSSGSTLYVRASPSLLQQIAFSLEGVFLPQSHEEGFDRAALRDLVLQDGLSRAFQLPADIAARIAQAGKFPVINPDGTSGFSSGTGADAGLRTDLAETAGANLIGYAGGSVSEALDRTITASTTINVGPTRAYTSIIAAFIYLLSCKITNGAIVTIKVDNGVYSTEQMYMAHPDGANIQILGNTANPSACVINCDATNNQSCFAAPPGFSIGFIDGFTIVGQGARAARTTWNSQCYGAGVYTAGSGSVHVGAHMIVDSFYYSYLSDAGGNMTVDPGALGKNAGDVAFHARSGSWMRAIGCKAATVAHLQGSLVLGSGFAAEANSTLECYLSEATDCQVGGAVSSSPGCWLWAMGIYAHDNVSNGVVSFGGALDIGIETVSGTASRVQNNQGSGVVAYNGGNIICDNPSGTMASITGNTFDGFLADGDFSRIQVSYATVTGNGGYGAKATNGAGVRLLDATLTPNTSGATFADTYSTVRIV